MIILINNDKVNDVNKAIFIKKENMISIEQAKELIECAKEYGRSIGTPEEILVSYHNHVHGVAEMAKMLATKMGIENPQRVYVLALLHDLGKVAERKKEVFHGVLGYNILKDTDSEASDICLTHMFPLNQIEGYDKMDRYFFYKENDYNLVREKLENSPLTDIDRIIQFSDFVSSDKGYVTIEEKTQELNKGRGMPEFALNNMLKNKRYLDDKLGIDVYELFKKVDKSFLIKENKKSNIINENLKKMLIEFTSRMK